MELLRALEFDRIVEDIKIGKYVATWIDWQMPKAFCGANRLGQVTQKLRALVTISQRYDVTALISTNRVDAWQLPQLLELRSKCKLHESKHRWCALGIKAGNQMEPSAVIHRIASSCPISDTPCRCSLATEHVYDVATGTASATHSRSAAEQAFVMFLLKTALQPRHAVVAEESKNLADSASESSNIRKSSHHMGSCQTAQPVPDSLTLTQFRFSTPLQVCEGCQLQVPADMLYCQFCGTDSMTSSYPTEERLEAERRRKAGVIPRKKHKVVEQHFDDCGENLEPIEKEVKISLFENYTSDESEVEELNGLGQTMSLWNPSGSSDDLPPDLTGNSYLACDIDEMLDILEKNPGIAWPWGVEIVEICGGKEIISYLVIKRKLRSGRGFELITGVDLSTTENHRKVCEYVKLEKPLVIVMAPVCTPDSPLARPNRITNQSARQMSFQTGEPIAKLCGQLAQIQLNAHKHFLVEQPLGSTMFETHPWPKVVQDSRSLSIVFDQCQVGQTINGLPARKPTELIASASELLKPFCGKVCDGSHQHIILTGAAAKKAQKWPFEMCSRIAHGIEQLAKAELKGMMQSHESIRAQDSYPSVAVETSEAEQAQTPSHAPQAPPTSAASSLDTEAWRKCKGCRWRLEKHDVRHSRVVGECKHANVESLEFNCPACKRGFPRSHESHTFNEDCRHALTSSRTGVRKRPFSRVPAEKEPTGSLKPSVLGRAAERAADDLPDIEPLSTSERPSSSADAICRPLEETPPNALVPREDSSISEAAGAEDQIARGPGGGRIAHRDSDAQTPVPSDWSSFDVSSSLRGIRFADEDGQRRILRKLHIRWWHISAQRLKAILHRAGIPKKTLDMIDGIVDTCRICRTWTRPIADTVASSRIITGFNIEVEGDLIFYRQNGIMNTILHLVDRGTRWAQAYLINGKTTAHILRGLDMWIGTFGAMQVLIFDGEQGLQDEEARIFFEIKGITKRTSAVGQHTRIVDRRTQVLRDTLHKISSQMAEEGLPVEVTRVLSEAVYAGNALTTINGQSPYTAVLGRVPSILPDAVSVADDTVGAPSSAHTHRLREIAIQAIVEGTARDRMKRALHTPTRTSGEEMEYRVGESVEYFRPPENKDASGWRGPATIVDLTRLEHGRIGIRTRADNVISCRVQDVRRCLYYWSNPITTAPHATSAQRVTQEFSDQLRKGSHITLGHIKDNKGNWQLTPSTKSHPGVYEAALYVASQVFQMINTSTVRFGHAIRSLPERSEFTGSITIYWTEAGDRNLQFFHSTETKISTAQLVGRNWVEIRCMQFLQMPDAEDLMAKTRVGSVTDIVSPDLYPAPVPASSPSHHSPSVSGRLSTIAEGSNEHGSQSEEAMITLEDLNFMFGHVPESKAPDLAEAYVSLTQELEHHEDQPQSTRDEVNMQQLVRASEAHIPSWPQVSNLVHDYKLTTDTQFSENLSSANMSVFHEPESDERGAYVAIDAYGHMSKLLPDLERIPQVGEHAEIRIYNTHTKKTIIQRDDDILTPEEELEHSQEVVQAILDELKTWQGFQCFERQKRSEARNVIDVRWVLKWKIKQGKRFIRARLCIRGFKDTGSDQDVNTSPTATRFSQRLLVSETAARRWSLASTDIPKAFLQGISYAELARETGREERQVSFELSGQPIFCLRQLPGFSDFNPASEVLRCTKPGTGCKDAPRAFNLKLKRVTAAFGFKPSIMDSELELWHNSKGELSMLLLKHVDDLKISGHKDDIEKLIQHLAKEFGKLDLEYHNFTFCGVRHRQNPDGSIFLDQMSFISAIREMQLQPEHKALDLLPEEVRRQFLSLLMTVAYALLTRPDAAVYVTALQRESHKAKPVHVRRLNTLIRWLKQQPQSLVYTTMEYPTNLVVYSDSGFQARSEDGLSVRGMIALRVPSSHLQDLFRGSEDRRKIPCHVVDFASKSQRHVTRSTFASELFACADAVDTSVLIRLALHEVFYGSMTEAEARDILQGEKKSPIQLYGILDAMSVSSAIVAPCLKAPAESSLLVHLRWFRQQVQRDILKLIWCDTRSMVADGLTKGSVGRELLQGAMKGLLVATVAMLAQKLR